ncbi:OmpA family protein [Desulfofalx alkaliphila]|uniref:OmpA family protein n=1 Tax=Desulfofalx alkaliphila TaxID=105483 RepID=UPI0004E19E57|nr:OmpA family protein [Desulfofalx alkaliphila]
MSNNRRQRNDEKFDESWLIPYADLLTLLLALFIVLFASSTIDSQKYNALKDALSAAFSGPRVIDTDTLPQTILENMEKSNQEIELVQLKQQLDLYIMEHNLDMDLKTTLAEGSLLITIRDYALFDSGKADVKPESKNTLVAMSNILEKYPNYEVVVSGHTDNVPINNIEFESNWDLSSKRAINFMKILLSNEKLNPYRFSAIGYGEYRPIATNETEEGRAQNRRVEVAIKPAANDKTYITLDEH